MKWDKIWTVLQLFKRKGLKINSKQKGLECNFGHFGL